MKRTIISLTIFIAFIGVIVGVFIGFLMIGQNQVLTETIDEIEFASVLDGSYVGSYQEGRWKNTVEVTIENGQVTEVIVLDDMTFQDDLLRTLIFERVKQASRLDEVDTVSGGTVSSIAYLKAIEDALKP